MSGSPPDSTALPPPIPTWSEGALIGEDQPGSGSSSGMTTPLPSFAQTFLLQGGRNSIAEWNPSSLAIQDDDSPVLDRDPNGAPQEENPSPPCNEEFVDPSSIMILTLEEDEEENQQPPGPGMVELEGEGVEEGEPRNPTVPLEEEEEEDAAPTQVDIPQLEEAFNRILKERIDPLIRKSESFQRMVRSSFSSLEEELSELSSKMGVKMSELSQEIPSPSTSAGISNSSDNDSPSSRLNDKIKDLSKTMAELTEKVDGVMELVREKLDPLLYGEMPSLEPEGLIVSAGAAVSAMDMDAFQ